MNLQVLAFGIIELLCLVATGFIIFQLGKIVKGRVDELDLLIKTLSREKKLEGELKVIHSYLVTNENKLNEIEKVIGLDNSNDNDF